MGKVTECCGVQLAVDSVKGSGPICSLGRDLELTTAKFSEKGYCTNQQGDLKKSHRRCKDKAQVVDREETEEERENSA